MDADADFPLVSALMVTQPSRKKWAARAVEMFNAQTYPNKELVVVNYARPAILGALRQETVDKANGEFLVQWDDDDDHHPNRIAEQLSLLQATNADCCFLSNETIKCELCGWTSTLKREPWDNSIMMRKSSLGELVYPMMNRSEDTEWIRILRVNHKQFCMLDAPHLYTYRFHGRNTWEPEHFKGFFNGHDTKACFDRSMRVVLT